MNLCNSKMPLGPATLALVFASGSSVAGSWQAPKTLQGQFAASSPPEAPVVAMNSSGHAVAVWDSTGAIRYAEHFKGGAWTGSAAVVPGATGGPVAVAIGADDTAAVAWTTVATRDTPSKLVVTVRTAGNSFPAPKEVAPAGYPKLGIAGNGTVTLLWNDGAGVHVSTLAPGGAWSVPVLISNAGTSTNLPDLVVNDAGAALAVWQEGAPGAPSAIAAVYRSAGGDWEAPVIVGSNPAGTWNPKPGIDAAGNAAVGYVDVDTARGGTNAMMVVTRTAGGPWIPPLQVSPTTQSVYYPALAMDQAGDVIAAWQVLDAGNYGSIWKRTRTPAGSWSANPIRLSARSDNADWPTAAYSGDGSVAVVTWVDDTAQTARAAVASAGSWSRSTLGTGWWGSTVPVSAGAGAIAAAWAVPNLSNPNAATIRGRTYE